MFRRVFQNYQDNIINPRTIPESDRPRTIWLVKYFELYKNGAFPIDLEMAKSDHDFLDNDVCKAFLRRLKVLNKYGGVLHLVIFACERDFQIHENFHLVKFSNHSILTKRKFASQFFLSNVSQTLFW